MRTHRVFPALQAWVWRASLLRELVSAEHLVAARIEPVTRGREPSAFVDLHFADGARCVTIPLVYLDLAQLELRESDPLVFPHGILGIVPDARARDVVELLFGRLERQAMTGGFWREETLRYGNGATFDAARARGFFGAAPLAVTLPRIAAAAYARRFAAGKHVMAYGSGAYEAAAFLSGVATSCAIVGPDDAEARAWYGEFEPAALDLTYDLAVGDAPAPVNAAVIVRTDPGAPGTPVRVATPVPADVMLDFAPAGAAAATFSVQAAREPFARPAALGASPPVAAGSSGRIAIAVRPDAAEAPDADTDEAAGLAQALRAEGFTVEVVAGEDALAAFAPDLVHLYGVRPGGYARRIAEWAAEQRKPLAVHALYESPSTGGYWGAMVSPYCFSYSGDDRSVGTYVEMLARRAVEVDGIAAGTPYAPAIAGAADAERVLALADVVLVNSERERVVVDALRPRRPTYVVPPVPPGTGAQEPVGARVGTDPFVLVHAPIWPEANQLVLARAALDIGAPLVFAGPVADPVYAERLREFAPDNVLLIDEPGPYAAAALYRAAAVVADAAWMTRGHGRLLAAAACGAAVVSSQARWLELPESDHWRVDPADFRSIGRGIGEAWDAAIRSDPRIRSAAVFARERLASGAAAIVATYAKIVQAI
jgi:glycosyltransferase involved in cell wall biosynthesis